ncbi:MAG: long-chain fatty acid--CoA ligase [Deltaproteobacteria bacterium]|nr:long-chain fatty acid--CoA ligase [Deltaproteobacteria bacterium]
MPATRTARDGTLTEAFFDRTARDPGGVALRRKTLGLWEELTWRDYEQAVRAVAAGLVDLGVKPGEPVGLISENRVEWLYTDLGILSAGAVTCAMYSTSAIEQIVYVMSHSDARVIIVEDEEQLDKLLEVREHHPVEHIIVMDDKGLRSFSDPGVSFFADLLERGRGRLEEDDELLAERLSAIEPDDLAILVYTSGTTGPPKGVMLSHGNITWACRSLEQLVHPRPDDEYLSFLPLCHIAERTITVFNQVLNGAVVNFAENLDTVRDNLGEVRPHVFFAVPRIWEKLYNAIELKMRDASWAKRQAYARALMIGRAVSRHRQEAAERAEPVSLPPGLALAHLAAEHGVLRPLRRKLGFDRTRFALSGAAPISAEVINYFQALGVPLVEAYGQTESTAIITLNPPGFCPPGTVGLPVDELELEIADDGEILARSPGVMLGYYKQAQATAETVDDDGWLHTGDVGEVDEVGRLRITDRKKDLIITAGGKNIAPQFIESKLRLSAYVHDAIVIGDGRKFVSALIILDEDNLVEWAQLERVQFGTYAELARTDKVRQLIDTEVKQVNDTLTHVEAVKQFRILERRLDQDEGELTPTLKVRRKAIEDKYGELIAEMYSSR